MIYRYYGSLATIHKTMVIKLNQNLMGDAKYGTALNEQFTQK